MSLITREAGKVRLIIGNYASLRRAFTKNDIETFASVIGDRDLVHFDSSAAAKLGFNANFVYGMMSASLITKLFRQTFPGAAYLSQTLTFSAPVYVDEEVETKAIIEGLEVSKSSKIKCFLSTTVEKVEQKTIAVKGNAILLLHPDFAEIVKNE
mmetsp:Transcript_30703/g.30349  ORF Transcript_30703/g.30349 Transcript_30703/m.30349 type:complete len:154 (+) Transcript_30703:18-479(+)